MANKQINRVKTATLVVPKYGLKQDFTIRHAERILRMGDLNGGWILPEDSKYYFSKEYGLRIKSNKGNTGKAV